MTLHLTWHGVPKGQPRAKATRRGAFVRMYTPDTADEMKDGIRLLAMHAMARGEWEHTTRPVEVVITAHFPRPASHFRRVRGTDVLKAGQPVYHDQKPDADNVAKAVMDSVGPRERVDRVARTALAALGPAGSWPGVWDDDKRVAVLTVSKVYAPPGKGPSVEVSVTRLPTRDPGEF